MTVFLFLLITLLFFEIYDFLKWILRGLFLSQFNVISVSWKIFIFEDIRWPCVLLNGPQFFSFHWYRFFGISKIYHIMIFYMSPDDKQKFLYFLYPLFCLKHIWRCIYLFHKRVDERIIFSYFSKRHQA